MLTEMLYGFLRRLLTPLFRTAIKDVEGLEHLPEHGGYLIAANHIDYLDGFTITVAVHRRHPRLVAFLSETGNYWWTGGATIPIDWQRKAESLERAVHALRRGTVICIFPEGRRNTTDMLLPGKTGLARLALWTGLPVIPVGLVGPSGSSFAQSLRTVLRRHAMSIRFGAPLRFSHQQGQELTKEQLTSVTTTIMERIAQLCEKRTET